MSLAHCGVTLAAAVSCSIALIATAAPITTPGLAEILHRSPSSHWRRPDPENMLYVEMPGGEAIIELAPRFAPKHVNILKTLARAQYFSHATIFRVEDDYVAQWGRQETDLDSTVAAPTSVDPEFAISAKGLRYASLNELDPYASRIGFSGGFPVAIRGDKAWLVHCYGALGVARSDDARSGNDTQLFVVIGQAPRQLDQNDTLVGRVLTGMELFSSLPRGKGERGFFAQPQVPVPILRVQVEADIPPSLRATIEVLREDSETFAAVVTWLRDRRDSWNKEPARHVDLCNVPIPVRSAK